MKAPPFLAVVDRGHINAYRFEKAVHRPPSPPSPVLIGRLELEEAFQKYEDRFTDYAGSFPSGAALGAANAVAERLSLKQETKLRLCRHLAKQLVEWLEQHQPVGWWLVAPAEINHLILEELPQKHLDILVCNLKQDLVHLPPSEILDRFNRYFAAHHPALSL